MPATTRWALPYPNLAAVADVPADIQALATALDDVGKDDQGLLAARPVSTVGSPGKKGRYWWSTDVARLSRDNGTGWDDVGGDRLGANGIQVRTALNTFTARTLTGTAGQITVANGDGVAGAPTISLPSTISLALTLTGATTIFSPSGTEVARFDSGGLKFGTGQDVTLTREGQGRIVLGGSTTQLTRYNVANTGGNATFGVEASVAGTNFTGSAAYATIVGSGGATSLQLITNGTVRLTIDSAGDATLTGKLTGVPNSQLAWTNISLNANWSAGASTPQYAKNPLTGIVYLRGEAVNNGSGGTTMTTLPAGFRPPAQRLLPISDTVPVLVALSVLAAGNVTVGTGTARTFSLDGAHFATN